MAARERARRRPAGRAIPVSPSTTISGIELTSLATIGSSREHRLEQHEAESLPARGVDEARLPARASAATSPDAAGEETASATPRAAGERLAAPPRGCRRRGRGATAAGWRARIRASASIATSSPFCRSSRETASSSGASCGEVRASGRPPGGRAARRARSGRRRASPPGSPTSLMLKRASASVMQMIRAARRANSRSTCRNGAAPERIVVVLRADERRSAQRSRPAAP